MNPRRPDNLKLLAGTARPDRAAPASPTLPALDGTPAPPAWLTNVAALSEFRRLSAVMTKNKTLTEGNVTLLAHAVMLGVRLSEAWQSNATPTAALITSYRRLMSDLGLSSMAAPRPADKPNRFRAIAERARR